MRSNFIYNIIFITSFFLVGCSSWLVLPEVPYSLAYIKSSLGNIKPGGIVRNSDNGRTFDSDFFSQTGTLWGPEFKEPYRLFLQSKVIGKRRPYKVKIQAFVQKKGKHGIYKTIGTSERLADKYMREFEKSITDRPKQRDFIDGFKAF